jgi:glycosyltransferase involved in cell wall biosynthesis
MRVAILTNDDPAHPRGGAGRIAGWQAELLKRIGLDVRVFCPSFDWLRSPLPIRLLHHWRDFGVDKKIARQIGGWQPDVLITHNLTGCGFGTPRSVGVRWIHILHDVQLFEPSGLLRDARKVTLWQRFWSVVRRRALGHPNLIISPTRWLLEQHRRRWFFRNEKAEVVPNPGPEIQAVEKLPHKPLKLLFIGRLTTDKGAGLLRQVISGLGFDFELHVVDDGPMRPLFENDPRIILHGVLPSAETKKQLVQADVLLIPSCIEENQPNVILEAAAFGLPVVASDKGGIKETLAGRGFVCAIDDPGCWKKSIAALCDPAEYARQSVGMRELAQAHDGQKYAQRLVELVKSNL